MASYTRFSRSSVDLLSEDMYSVLAHSFLPFTDSLSSWTFNPLTPIIKGQILLSCPHTFLIKVLREVIKISKKIHLW